MQQASSVRCFSGPMAVPGRAARLPGRARPLCQLLHRQRLAMRALPDDADDAQFEARLAALKQAKGDTPAGEGRKGGRKATAGAAAEASPRKDFSDETLKFEYRFTDRRLSTITTAPWKNEQLDAAYEQVKDVVSIGRGVGLWGDMVVTLRDGSKVELRALPRYREMQEYILQRRDELTGGGGSAGAARPAGKGFA